MSTKKAREALILLAHDDDLTQREKDSAAIAVLVALDELDQRRAADGDVEGRAWQAKAWGHNCQEMAARVLSAHWLNHCDTCSVTHNPGEGG